MSDDIGEYRCINCSWAERVEIFERKRAIGEKMHCPECRSRIRGHDEVLFAESLVEFLKQ